jgi:hypothetical protein
MSRRIISMMTKRSRSMEAKTARGKRWQTKLRRMLVAERHPTDPPWKSLRAIDHEHSQARLTEVDLSLPHQFAADDHKTENKEEGLERCASQEETILFCRGSSF